MGRSLIEQAASTAALPDAGVASPEQLQLRRARAPVEVTFVTVDKSYKPAVSTWGVFPRPLDISKEYGGGRNLVPGAPLEADGAAAARLARVRAGVGAYRLAAGLEVSAEAEAACAASTSAGDAALAAGRLEAAAALYREACAAAPAGCAVGGAARLGLALALDSAGDAAGAKALYLELKGHTDAEVRKKATRLLWGMTEASEFLKADSFTYLAGLRESYEVHLSAAVTTDGVMREGGGEGAGGAERAAAAAAVALLALPAGLLALLRGLAAGAHAAGG